MSDGQFMPSLRLREAPHRAAMLIFEPALTPDPNKEGRCD
jgi:hypothetical protein